MKEIELKINVGAKELWQFSMYHANRGMLGAFNLIFTLAALFLLATQWGTLTPSYRLLLAGCALLFTVIQPLMLLQKAAKQAKAPAFKEPTILRFTGDGLTVMQGEQQADFGWDQIGLADRRPTMLVIYMDRVHAYLVPNDQATAQWDELLELLKEHLPKERRKRIE